VLAAIYKPVFLIVTLFITISSFSQEKNITYSRDTISLISIKDLKLVAFEIKGVTILGSYRELLDILKRVKKSQFRDGKKKLNICINYMKKTSRKQDTINVTSLIQKHFDIGLAYLFFCRKLNEGKAIVIDNHKIIHNTIIREKSTYHGGMLSSWGASQYYLMNSKIHFLKVNDWRSKSNGG
jgi:hypothetical protein